MTDGNTAIQVSPTEDEMNHVRDILTRMVNAVVGMSQLQADVEMLRSTVQGLQADSERLRKHNEALDDALFQSRQARNELSTRLGETQHALSEVTQDRDDRKHLNEVNEGRISTLQESLHRAEQERDEAQLRQMELEDQLKAQATKLDAIQEGYRSIFGEATPAVPAVQAVPVPEPSPVAQHEPVSVPEPAPVSTFLETSEEWRPGYSWDQGRGLYVKGGSQSSF